MFERFTNQSRRVVVLAQEEARMLNHNYIGTEHLLLGLLREGRGSAARAMESMGVTLDAARDEVVASIGRGKAEPSGHIPFTPPVKKSLELSLREALDHGDNYIGTGHLLLGLIRQGDNGALKGLVKLGADPGELRDRVTAALHDDPESEVAGPEKFARARLKVSMSPEVKGLLEDIDERLSAIEQRLGITRPDVAALNEMDRRIARVVREKEAAIEAQDFGRAAALRDTEKQLRDERTRLEQKMQAGPGPGAVGGSGPGAVGGSGPGAEAGELGEVARLRARVTRLEARLREHGIEPGEPGEPPVADG
jgi:ATP-dependent Clp protease ATP-binding subunit ClpA